MNGPADTYAADVVHLGEQWLLGGVLYEVAAIVEESVQAPYMAHSWAPPSSDDDETEERIHLARPGQRVSQSITVAQALQYISNGGFRPMCMIPDSLACWSEAEQEYYRTA